VAVVCDVVTHVILEDLVVHGIHVDANPVGRMSVHFWCIFGVEAPVKAWWKSDIETEWRRAIKFLTCRSYSTL
jgi:hypothetical protein